MALEPLPFQQPVKPEPVQPRLLNDDDRKDLPGLRRSLAPQLGQPPQQPRHVSPLNAALRHLLALARRKRRDQPRLAAQFQRNENRAKLRADGGRVFQVIAQHRSSPG